MPWESERSRNISVFLSWYTWSYLPRFFHNCRQHVTKGQTKLGSLLIATKCVMADTLCIICHTQTQHATILKFMEVQAGRGVSCLGNPGGREGENVPIHRGVWIFSGVTHSAFMHNMCKVVFPYCNLTLSPPSCQKNWMLTTVFFISAWRRLPFFFKDEIVQLIPVHCNKVNKVVNLIYVNQ